MSDAPTFPTMTIGPATVTPRAPSSPTIRLELIQAMTANADGAISLRTAAALVGLCWPSDDRRRPSRRYVGSIADYGAFVADDLLGAGVSVAAIMQAGVVCAQLVIAVGVPGLSRPEVDAATRPTAAPEGASP